ncbi:hypothetical protein QJS10_CPB13g01129 [Acorus calamus]|uniref:C2H2-type domain-containing protein n=1 Tax=Acorus calamus TaxID=4465 RepID=A0AAV9DF78_ACOCL|nr:hypothetical protein QJS10_CPB13g01129 [Acorus calamus]
MEQIKKKRRRCEEMNNNHHEALAMPEEEEEEKEEKRLYQCMTCGKAFTTSWDQGPSNKSHKSSSVAPPHRIYRVSR